MGGDSSCRRPLKFSDLVPGKVAAVVGYGSSVPQWLTCWRLGSWYMGEGGGGAFKRWTWGGGCLGIL